MKTSTKIAIGIALIGCTVIVAQAVALSRAKAKAQAEQSKAAKAELAAAGFQRLLDASQREIERTVPSLREELEAAKKAHAPVILAGRTITKTVPFEVTGDCPQSQPPQSGVPAPHTASATVTAEVSVESQVAVVAVDDGTIEWTQRLFATVDGTKKPMPLESSNVAIDSRLRKAWAAYVSGLPWQADVRVGASFPHPGLMVGGSYFGRKHRTGVFADVSYGYRDVTDYVSYYEQYKKHSVGAWNVTAGATWRIGPR